MDCEKLLPGCFTENGLFAFQSADRDQALEYLRCCLKQGLSWSDVSAQIQHHLEAQQAPMAVIATQLERARAFLSPWLDQ